MSDVIKELHEIEQLFKAESFGPRTEAKIAGLLGDGPLTKWINKERGTVVGQVLAEISAMLMKVHVRTCKHFASQYSDRDQVVNTTQRTLRLKIELVEKLQAKQEQTDEEIYTRVLNLFLEKWPSRESHSRLGKQMDEAISAADWQAYRKVAMRSAKVGEICCKHFESKSKKEAEKQKLA